MSTLHELVGLPGSGKSTSAKEFAFNTGATILSSDDLREELYGDVDNQENNGDVFEELYTRAENLLSDGKDVAVILDATNISSKRRKVVVDRFRKKADNLVAHYFNTPFAWCLDRNESRERKVPHSVITNMYKSLHVPTQEEGWDDVVLHHARSKGLIDEYREDFEKLITNHCDYKTLFKNDHGLRIFSPINNIIDFPQDSKYHTLSVSRHTYHVWEYIVKNYNGRDKLAMLWASLLHDTGKVFTKNFKRLEDGTNSRYANFIGHENVSAQLTVDTLNLLGYDDNFILNVVLLVQNHMRLLSIGDSPKGRNKLFNFVGNDVFEMLEFFRVADTNAK